MTNPPVVTRRVRARRKVLRLPFTREHIRPAFHPDLRAFRERAWEVYEAIPMPTLKDEPWRRTDIRGLPADTLRLPEAVVEVPGAPVPDTLQASPLGEALAGQLVLSMEEPVLRTLDASLTRRGVIFTDLRTAEQEHPDLLARLVGRVVKPQEGKFAALGHALARNGALVYIPQGVQLEKALHVLFWGPGGGLAYFDHLLVWLEPGARATLVVEWASPDESTEALHVGVVEVHVAEDAELTWVELQSWGTHMWNFTHERAQVGRNARLNWILGAVGSKLTKSFMDVDLVAPGAEGYMSGFYFADDHQHLDHDTQQNHLAPHTTSDLLFKGAVKDAARSVWQGLIYVAPGAQGTDGYQANRNLVLNSGAQADSIPGLEIMANEVRCTHGATVSRMDEEQIFYMRTRGVPRKEAERLLIEGFFAEILDRIPFEKIRERFRAGIARKMGYTT